ncbi:hypothetical protein HK104_007229 [Borealophlyctis nickersoniae]|nr:hypothetical protein HK104_007229 [Borealophlyctis nickersoniae]
MILAVYQHACPFPKSSIPTPIRPPITLRLPWECTDSLPLFLSFLEDRLTLWEENSVFDGIVWDLVTLAPYKSHAEDRQSNVNPEDGTLCEPSPDLQLKILEARSAMKPHVWVSMRELRGADAEAMFQQFWGLWLKLKRLNQKTLLHLFFKKGDESGPVPPAIPASRPTPILPYDILLLISRYARFEQAIWLRCADCTSSQMITRRDLTASFKNRDYDMLSTASPNHPETIEELSLAADLKLIRKAILGGISVQGAADLVWILLKANDLLGSLDEWMKMPYRSKSTAEQLFKLVMLAAHKGYSAVIQEFVASGLQIRGSHFHWEGTSLQIHAHVPETAVADHFVIPLDPTPDHMNAVLLLMGGWCGTQVSYENAFFRALKLGQVGIIKMLLDHRIRPGDGDLSHQFRLGLKRAIKGNQQEVVEVLLQSDIPRTDEDISSLAYSSAKSTLGILELFLKRVKGGWNLTHALQMAVSCKKFENARLLIEAGANPTDGLVAAVNKESETSDDGDLCEEMLRFLIERGADLSGEMAMRAMRAAASRNCVKLMKLFMDAGVDARAGDDELLCWAAGNPHADVLKLLIQAGCDVHARNDWPIRFAAEKERLDSMVVLIEAGARFQPEEGDSLHASAAGPCVQFLLEVGTGAHPLCVAASKGLLPLVKYYLTTKAEIHSCTDGPLRFAAHYGHLTTVQALIAGGAYVNADASYALRAAVCGHATLTNDFIEKSIDFAINDNILEIKSQDIWGIWSTTHKPLRYWNNYGSPPITRNRDLHRDEIVLELISHGANVTVDSCYALRIASAVCSRRVVQALLSCEGADVHAMGDQALALAAMQNSLGVVRCLLEAGADVSARPIVVKILQERWPDEVESLVGVQPSSRCQAGSLE